MPVHETEPAPGILRITLDDPAKANALSPDVLGALAASLDRLATDDAVRVGILTGSGTVFCSGGDTSRMGDARPGPWDKREYLDRGVGELARRLTRNDKPLVAAVNGPAVGAGMDLALWCDFRMASRGAYLLPGFVGLGTTPGFGGAWLLTHLLGRSRALEILLTGRRILAEDALAAGLYRSLSESAEELEGASLEFAAELAAQPAPAVRFTKRLVQRAPAMELMDSLELAWSGFALLQETPEHADAVRRMRERGDRARGA
jgi:2-(1,2-epoxy-1,2-dihydrophenyl)acetyl-CoA isomerase